MKAMPIRWRLSLWYAALVATTLVLFAAALFWGLRWRLYQAFDDQLASQAAVTAAAIRFDGATPILALDEQHDSQQGEYVVRLLGTDGRVLSDTSAAIDGLPTDSNLIARVLAGRTVFTSSSIDGETLRLLSVPVLHGSAIAGVLQVGLFRGETDEALHQLFLALLAAVPLVLVVAVASGYVLAGRALRPVVSIAELAARVSGSDLSARLHLDLPDDELGRLVQTFNAMLARIEEAFERQRRFTGDAAHELRTPLALMRSQIDLALARPRGAEAYREALGDLSNDLDRLTAIVHGLLTLARADADRLPLTKEPFDLADTIHLVIEQFAPRASALQVTLRDASSPTQVVADEDLLVQVLANLLDNALAATPPGGEIEIGCERQGDYARLWVHDTGIGIAPEHQPHVFERFYRVDAGRVREHGGAGLGLALCRAIVDAHGGTINLFSKLGQGTRVEIILPA